MDLISNPFAPGAGNSPPVFAGRDELLEKIRICCERSRRGRQAKSAMLVGLRGAGKTVLLDKMRIQAESSGLATLRI